MGYMDYLIIAAVLLLAAISLIWYGRRRKTRGGCSGNCAQCGRSCGKEDKGADGK